MRLRLSIRRLGTQALKRWIDKRLKEPRAP